MKKHRNILLNNYIIVMIKYDLDKRENLNLRKERLGLIDDRSNYFCNWK